MNTDTDPVVTVTEAGGDFLKIAGMAEKSGKVVVSQDGRPRWLVIDLDKEPRIVMSGEEKLELVARRILREHRAAFEELAK